MVVATAWLHHALLFCGILFNAAGAFVGINIGTGVSDIPPPLDIVAILRAHRITHVRLFDADARMLHALSNTGIEVMVSVRNDEVLQIGESATLAAEWIAKNVAAYVPSTNITAVAVGSEVLSVNLNASVVLFPAVTHLYRALVASNLNHLVKVSTPQSMDIIPQPFPPSTAAFNSTWNSTMVQILQFLRDTDSFYMVNAHPYNSYANSNGIFLLDYALYKPLSRINQVVDPNTLFHYSGMLDAMVDAVYYSIAALNFSTIPVVVTETGWPWFGGPNEPDANTENAEAYINNLVSRVLNDSGPPSEPSIPINTYIYELFNEDRRPGPVSEKYWGILFSNGSAVYNLNLDLSTSLNSSSTVFCIARPDGNQSLLQDGIDWACGPGGANCSAIQAGQACYLPNTLENHASYAYNQYYQMMQSSGATCDFRGTASLTNNDPSYGSCIFSGSSNSSSGGNSPPSPAPGTPPSGSSANGVGFGILFSELAAMLLFDAHARIFAI